MKHIRKGLAALILAAGTASIATLSVATAADATAADAGSPPPPPSPGGMGGMHGPEHFYEKLGLTADQKSRADAIFAAKGPTLKNLHEQLHANMETLHKLSPDDPNYAATVSQVAQSNGSLTTQLISAEGDMRAQLYANLTPAQKTQLKALEAKMAEHMKQGGPGKGHWGHRPPPPPGAPDAPDASQ